MSVEMELVDDKIRAIGIKSLYGGAEVLEELLIPVKPLEKREIRVKIHAVSVNPIDYKARSQFGQGGEVGSEPRILGYDGAGEVVEVGPNASLFKVGDKVMFAGALNKSGTNADYTIVDEQLVGLMPTSLSYPEAASLPLVCLTAWEGLFEEMGLKAHDPHNASKTILVLPGAGGVGSMVIQMARKLLGLTVVATASRKESEEFCKEQGAHYVINHTLPLAEQLTSLSLPGASSAGQVDFIFNSYDPAVNLAQYSQIVKPLGKIVSILNATEPLDINPLFFKRVSYSQELMFTRSLFGVDMIQQHYILNEVARLVEEGVLKHTVTVSLPYSLENLKKAHGLVEEGKMRGKAVLYKEA